MDWTAAGSAFAGAFVGVVVIILGFLTWDYFDRRKSPTFDKEKPLPKVKDLHDEILERHLEELVVSNFDHLFPGWAIYSTDAIGVDNARPSGVRYRTPAGEIDLLCTDEDNNLVVIELKRNRAPDKVVSQLDRYIAWVERNIAQPGQSVRGIIVARKHSEHVVYSASRHADMELWTYDLKLTLMPKLVAANEHK
jgi:RecB family endonuclease NucS